MCVAQDVARKGDEMPAPVVIRLTEQIDQSHDLEERAILQAMLGSYLARVGQFEQAERARLELRREFNDGRSLRVTVRLMCLEALLLYFRDLSPLARDRLTRAHVLAKASRDSGLIALTSSWLAHIDFNLSRFEGMANALYECALAVGQDDIEAECRAAVVLGDAYMHAGERQRARNAYERARQLAVRIGDQASIGALTYNPAALHVASLRLMSLDQDVATSELALAATEVQSAINYQVGAGLSSLDHLLHTAKVGIFVLERRFAEAANLARNVLEHERVPSASAQAYLLKADIASGLGQSGQLDDSRLWTQQVPLDEVDKCEPDDRALILASLSQAHESCGESQVARELHERSIAALYEHRGDVARVQAILANLRQRLSRSAGEPAE